VLILEIWRVWQPHHYSFRFAADGAGQILLNNFFSDIPAVGIANDASIRSLWISRGGGTSVSLAVS